MSRNWPVHVLAAGVLVWNGQDRTLLMVRTHHRGHLILPGGLVEAARPEAPGQ